MAVYDMPLLPIEPKEMVYLLLHSYYFQTDAQTISLLLVGSMESQKVVGVHRIQQKACFSLSKVCGSSIYSGVL